MEEPKAAERRTRMRANHLKSQNLLQSNRRLALGRAKKPREPGKVGQQVRWWPGDGSSTPQFVVGLELAELVVVAGKVGSRK